MMPWLSNVVSPGKNFRGKRNFQERREIVLKFKLPWIISIRKGFRVDSFPCSFYQHWLLLQLKLVYFRQKLRPQLLCMPYLHNRIRWYQLEISIILEAIKSVLILIYSFLQKDGMTNTDKIALKTCRWYALVWILLQVSEIKNNH